MYSLVKRDRFILFAVEYDVTKPDAHQVAGSPREGKPRNFTFHLSREGQGFFAERVSPGNAQAPSRADILHSVLAAYRTMLAANLPDLSVSEWALVCDAVPHDFPTSDAITLPLWPDVDEGIAFNGLDKKWGVDGSALTKKLRDLTPMANIAAWDLVARMWAEEGTAAWQEKTLDRIQRLVDSTRKIRANRGSLPID